MQPDIVILNIKEFRIGLKWTLWVLMNIVSSVFGVLCCVVARKLHRVFDEYYGDDMELRSVIIVSCFMPLVIILFICVSFIMMLGQSKTKSFPNALDAALLCSYLHMFLITLLCATAVHGSDENLKEELNFIEWRYDTKWSSGDVLGVFRATYIMAYITSGMYLICAMVFGCIAILFNSTSDDEVQIGVPSDPHVYQPMAV
eukprot:g6657.t1